MEGHLKLSLQSLETILKLEKNVQHEHCYVKICRTRFNFREREIHLNVLANRRAWSKNYCDNLTNKRRKYKKKIKSHCHKHNIKDFKVRNVKFLKIKNSEHKI